MSKREQPLMILKYIQEKSSENSPLSKSDIMNFLESENLPICKNTVNEILKAIGEVGYDLITVKNGKYKYYYIPNEVFDKTEARVITDAVISATFITQEKTRVLLSKILNLTDKEMRVHYMNDIIRYNRHKHSNKSTYYTTDAIQEAIEKNKRLSFRHFLLDENGGRVYSHNNKIYDVTPITLMNDRNNYYLISYDPKTGDGKERTFRIDRIEDAVVVDKEQYKVPFDREECIERYQSSVFSMYGGKKIIAEFEFDFKTMNIIYDQYGENIEIMKIGENRYYAKLPIEDSPTFWGWLFMLGKRIRIISPSFLMDEYKNKLDEIRMFLNDI